MLGQIIYSYYIPTTHARPEYYRVIEWAFSHWSCIISKDNHIGPRTAVLSRGEAEA